MKQLFAHPLQIIVDPPNLSVKLDGANGINLFLTPSLKKELKNLRII